MVVEGATINNWIDAYMLVLIRISAMIAAAPVISAPYVPVRIQVLLSVILAMIILPLIQVPTGFVLFSLPGFILAAEQVLLGLGMGFILKIIFEIFTFAGQFMAMQSGLGYAMVVDPQRGTQVAVIGQLFTITASLVFIISNGHLAFIQMIADSFEHMPIVKNQLKPQHFSNLAYFGRELFVGGINIALPAVTALLLLNFSMAMMNRAAPQLHLFTIGFPLMLLVGLMAIYLTYGSTFSHTEDEFGIGFQFMNSWLGGR